MIIFLDDSVDGFFKGGTDTCNGHFDISSLESSFSDKSQKISTRTIPEHTIFGYGNQLNRNDTDPSTRGKREDCVTVPGSTGGVSVHEETKSINSASTSTVSSHAATINFRIAGNGITTQKETMSAEVKAEELDWWVQNLHLAKGRLTISASL